MSATFVYGRNGSGGRNVGVEIDGIRVLVESHGEEQDAAALRLARSIAERHEASVVSDGERAAHRRSVQELSAMVSRAEERARIARSALVSAVEGRRRFFGPALCVPDAERGWSGPVWLLDPEKRDRGYGLRFASLAELRALHPELWIVDVIDEGVLLDAVRLPPQAGESGGSDEQ